MVPQIATPHSACREMKEIKEMKSDARTAAAQLFNEQCQGYGATVIWRTRFPSDCRTTSHAAGSGTCSYSRQSIRFFNSLD